MYDSTTLFDFQHIVLYFFLWIISALLEIITGIRFTSYLFDFIRELTYDKTKKKDDNDYLIIKKSDLLSNKLKNKKAEDSIDESEIEEIVRKVIRKELLENKGDDNSINVSDEEDLDI